MIATEAANSVPTTRVRFAGSETAPPRQVSKATLIVFRYAFVFFCITSFFRGFPLSLLQAVPAALYEKLGITEHVNAFWGAVYGDHALGWVFSRWQEAVDWFGNHVLGFAKTYDPAPSGSGDKNYDYAQVVLIALISIVPTILWTALTWPSRSFPRTSRLLWVGARFFLASTMFGYGYAKVIKNQFVSPGLAELLLPIGDQSPMGLVWRFMGFSTAYTVFAGLGEVVGGILLCFRRTATLGALVVVGVMTNVCMLNYAYDVPVKLYATYYLVLAIAITIPDASRLLAVLVFNRPAPPRDLTGPFSSPAANHVVTVLTLFWIASVAYSGIDSGLDRYNGPFGEGREKSPLLGVYDVERFSRDGAELPPLTTDPLRWNRFVSDYPQFLHVYLMNGSLRAFSSEIDPKAQTITLTDPRSSSPRGRPTPQATAGTTTAPAEPAPPKARYTWTYREVEPKVFQFDGQLDGHTYSIRARRRTPEDFELTKRGFNWISPFPYNR